MMSTYRQRIPTGLLLLAWLLPGFVAPCLGQTPALSNPVANVVVTGPRWVATGNLNIARYGHTATLLADGKVLVVGGAINSPTSPGLSTDTTELYNPTSGTWSVTGRRNLKRLYSSATLLADGRVLVVDSESMLTELYNPGTDAWSIAGRTNCQHFFPTATLLQSGKVLVVGYGHTSGCDAEVYDPAADRWTRTGGMRTPRVLCQATLLRDGRVLVTGGTDDPENGVTFSSTEIYDPIAGTWIEAAPLIHAREPNTATLLQNGMVLVTGDGIATELFDPSSGRWSTTGDRNSARVGHTATLLPDGKVLVTVGYDSPSSVVVGSTEIYDPGTGRWEYTSNLGTPRTGHTATLLPTGKVLVAGGYGSSLGVLDSAELYGTPADNSFRMTAMFTDQAGLYQYIQLQELSGLSDQHHFTGLTLTARSRNGIVKTVTFPNDLPESNTAGRYVMIGTSLGPPVDFALPAGFIPTDGGTLTFAGIDVWEYPVLPADGHAVLLRDNTFASNPPLVVAMIFRTFGGHSTGLSVQQDPAIEYYNETLDHYFITASQPDIDALDSHRTPGWTRTGELFPAFIKTGFSGLGWPPNLRPVCRFWIPPAVGDSHFFSVSSGECAAAQAIPGYVLETNHAFFASLPNEQTGACLYDQIPVYRLWNGRFDSNHRYTTSPRIRDLMRSKGYIAEGYGPDAVAMCVGGGISND